MSQRRVLASFSLVGFLILFLLVSVFVFGFGIGIGYLLRKIFGTELGIAILTGIVATGICTHFAARMIGALNGIGAYDELDSDEDVDNDDDEDESINYPALQRRRRRGRGKGRR